ncbi:MAG: 8-oxo-dGTP diphosphatase MutT [Thermoanaerobaculaceae bacterium]
MGSIKARLVVAGVIRDRQGRVLLARRLPSAHLGGFWEFPGGGVEEGESPEEALKRELKEELGVEVAVKRPITFAWHRDGRRTLLLLFYQAEIVKGVPVGQQGQEIRWVGVDELQAASMPPADQELVRLLKAS